MIRRWNVAPPPPPDFQTAFHDVPNIVQQVLWGRNIRDRGAADLWLAPDYASLADPFLFRQMREAVDRIVRAITAHEQIMIFGDYDADGVTSTTIMVETLQALGGNVQWYLPERLSEGYGLNIKAIGDFASRGVKLLITVDCGTSNVEEIQRAKDLGLDVIVLDHHHEPAKLPPADAIINPVFADELYPWRGFSSAGVAFTVVRALLQATQRGQTLAHPIAPGWEKWLLDIVAISTVADMMPLRGENRTLVHFGLTVLRKTRRPGLRALFATMGSDVERADEYTIGFMLAPRLNAAGRLHHASMAVELLLTTSPRRARELADQLQAINQDRQRLTELAVSEALEQVPTMATESAAAFFAPHWSPGILGLVAGRLADRLWRPVVVMAENDGRIVGSGRSVPNVNIMDVMDAGREYFSHYGGHPGACGFTLTSSEQREAFSNWWREHVGSTWDPQSAAKTLEIDGLATTRDFTANVLDYLETLGPYGIEHQRPRFMLSGARILEAHSVGNDRQHLRLLVRDQHGLAKAIGFRFGERRDECRIGQTVDLAVEVSWNVWQGRREPQIRIIDVRPTL